MALTEEMGEDLETIEQLSDDALSALWRGDTPAAKNKLDQINQLASQWD